MTRTCRRPCARWLRRSTRNRAAVCSCRRRASRVGYRGTIRARSCAPTAASEHPAMTLDDLARTWYHRADELAPFAPNVAEAFRRAAQELDGVIRDAGIELLTLEQASVASGYSTDHLSRQIREGRIPNAGTKHRPR